MELQQVFDAFAEGNIEGVLRCLESHPSIGPIIGPDLLDAAITRRDDAMADALLEHGVPVDPVPGRNGYPLLKAVQANDVPTAQKLLNRGANPTIPMPNGGHPLFFAARKRHPNMVRLLLEHGAYVHQPGCEDVTPLMAALSQHVDENDDENAIVETIELLLDAEASANNVGRVSVVEGIQMFYPLNVAIKFHQPIRVFELLLNRGAKIWSNPDGKTPLFFAIRARNREIVQVLIDRGVDVNERIGTGVLPLKLAFDLRWGDGARLLLKAGARIKRPDEMVIGFALCGMTEEFQKSVRGRKAFEVQYLTEDMWAQGRNTDQIQRNVACLMLWETDMPISRALSPKARRCMKRKVKREVVKFRRALPLLRKLYNERFKEWCGSPLTILPWHVAREIVRFVTLTCE